MENKTIMTAAFLAVMAAMTGMAAADPFTVGINKQSPDEDQPADSPTLIPLTGTATLSLKIGSIRAGNVGGTYSLTCSILPASAAVTVSCPSTFVATSTNFVIPDALKITSSGAPTNTEYQLSVTGAPAITLKADPTAGGGIILQTIPEFPAVAFPTAAVIGLVYFFHHRRRKDE